MRAREEVMRTVLSRHEMSPNSGCLAKIGGLSLASLVGEAFRAVPGVGVAPTELPEDCAVIDVAGGSLLLTTDFGPLVGPDLYRAGRIAATHAMSDVYAMGGTPIAALVMLVVDPALPRGAAANVEAGLLAACQDDGVPIVGGHTIEGQEAMAGLSVIGVPGDRILRKSGARAGDQVMLSKPIGTGMILRAFQEGVLEFDQLDEALASMETSNRAASRAAAREGAVAVTDITGFGLLGHLAEMMAADGLGVDLRLDSIPVLSAAQGLPPSLTRSRFIDDNLQYCRNLLQVTGLLDRARVAALLDPQTSGGLLAIVPGDGADALRQAGFAHVGEVTSEPRIDIAP